MDNRLQAIANCNPQSRTQGFTTPPSRRKSHLKGVAIQLTDVVCKLFNILGDTLVSVGETTKGGGSIVGTVAAVLLVQMVGQSALERNLNPFLHVLETTVHHCRRDGDTSKGSQEPSKLRKLLQAGRGVIVYINHCMSE